MPDTFKEIAQHIRVILRAPGPRGKGNKSELNQEAEAEAEREENIELNTNDIFVVLRWSLPTFHSGQFQADQQERGVLNYLTDVPRLSRFESQIPFCKAIGRVWTSMRIVLEHTLAEQAQA